MTDNDQAGNAPAGNAKAGPAQAGEEPDTSQPATDAQPADEAQAADDTQAAGDAQPADDTPAAEDAQAADDVQAAEDPGYLTQTGEAVGEDGSVVPIIGGLPAAEGSAWDIGAPRDERGADLAEEMQDSRPDNGDHEDTSGG